MTIVARRVASNPVRTANQTWSVITDILAPRDSAARKELARIGGVACSLIASESTEKDAMVVWATALASGSIAFLAMLRSPGRKKRRGTGYMPH